MTERWNQKLMKNLTKNTKEELNKNELSFLQKQFLSKQLKELKALTTVSKEKKLKFLDKDQLLRKDIYEEYTKIPEWIKNKILKGCFLYEEYEKDAFYEEVPISFLTTKEILEESWKYAQWLDYKPFLQFFQKYFLEHHDFLQMTFQNPNYLGETITFFVRNHYYPFIRMNRKNTLEDIATLSHELFHAYYFKWNEKELENTYSWYLSELEGDCSDFLFPLYLQEKKVSPKIIETFQNNYFANGFYHLYLFYLCNLVCNQFTKTQKIDLEKLELQTLESPFAFYDNDLLKSILSLEPIQSAKYALAFLINLDLATIYEMNPQKALEILENIRKQANGSFFQTLNTNHVHFYEDNYKRIREYIQKASH